MSNTKTTVVSGGSGVGFGGLLTLLFITLKLTGVIAWSWLWVLAPLWIPLALVLAVGIIVGLAVLLGYVLKKALEK